MKHPLADLAVAFRLADELNWRKPTNRGQKSSPAHPGARFTARQVRRIRREFARGHISARAIARRLGVAPATIVNMVARRSYREVR